MNTDRNMINQEAIRRELGEKFNIDPERILFLNDKKPEEPWLPAEALMTIARQSGEFQAIDETVEQYIAPLNQIVHRATVIKKDGTSFGRCGVATIGERQDIDDHALAAGRALAAALTAAGFNPLRPGAVVSLELNLPRQEYSQADEAKSRTTDLKRIHAIGIEKGLIQFIPGAGKDDRGYRQMLKEKYGVGSAVAFDGAERASLINYMEQLPAYDEFADVA